MFSVRIVDADFYVTKPTADLDVLYSEFRESNVARVPVIRIFGSTPSGQKSCLQIHRVFPYIFVPYDGTKPCEKYLKQLATSIDFAVQVAFGKATSATNHVYKTEIVKRIPFYGYYEDEQEFIKIQFYNPRMVAKVVDLLQNGAILNKIFQPYESHIPYILQFLIDFNLYGMNLLHAQKVYFRGWSDSQCPTSSPDVSSCSPNDSSSFHASATSWQHWNKNTIPSDLRLGSDIAKTSRCELEVDVIAEDILNRLEIGTSIGRNPGIAAMWEDEKQRRRDHGQPSQISIPVSQDRGEMQLLASEREFKTRIREVILERNQMIQSQLEIMEKSLSPEDFQELSQSILLEGKEPSSQAIIRPDVDENIPVVDQSVIEDVLQASQSQPNSLSGQIDEELVAILLSLAEDPNDAEPQECSPKSNTSQMIMSEDKERGSDEDNEDEESIIMSQPVWNDDLIEECESRSQSADDDDEEDWKPQRIPQFDGPADDDTPLLGNRSTTVRTQIGRKKKISTNKEIESDDDDDDFKTKKKAIITGKNKNISKTKREQTTRQRKTAIAQLNVRGGDSKQRNHHESSASFSEVATKTMRHLPFVGSNNETVNWNDGKFPNLELFHQSSKPRTADKGILDCSEAGESGSLLQHKNEAPAKKETTLFKNKGSSSKTKNVTTMKSGESKEIKDCLLHLETESSGSQTSEFELRLSDSSSDGDDFKCKKKVPRISEEVHKLERFYVAKQAPVEVNFRTSEEGSLKHKQSKSRNTEWLDKDTKVNRKSSSGVSKKIKSNSQKPASNSTMQKYEVGEVFSGVSSCKFSEKNAENSTNNLESRKRKRTRSKQATCLMFTHVSNQAKADKSNISKTGKSRNSEKCSVPGTDSDMRKMHSKLSMKSEGGKTGVKECSRNSKKVKNEGKVPGNWENTSKVKKENEAMIHRNSRNSKDLKNKGKVPGNRILLDASIKLEKISVDELKSKNVLARSSQKVNDVVSLTAEMKDDSHSSKDTLIDDELDSLYQMAMLSPRSVEGSVEGDVGSPPLPSSPSLNLTSDDQSLDNSLINFPGKDESLNVSMSKGYSIRQTTEDIPITFISEERVKRTVSQSGSASKEPIVEELNTTVSLEVEEKSSESGTQHNDFPGAEELFMESSMPRKDITPFKGEFDSKEDRQINEYAAVDLELPKSLTNHTDGGVEVKTSDSPEGALIQGCLELPEDRGCMDRDGVIEDTCESQEIYVGSSMDVREQDVCRDMYAVSPGISAVCDSFSVDEKDQSRLDIQELLKDIETPRALEGQRSLGKNNIDINQIVKDIESPRVVESQGSLGENIIDLNKIVRDIESPCLFEGQESSRETDIQSYDNSEKSDNIKIMLSFKEGDDQSEDYSVMKCSDDQDILGNNVAKDKDHSFRQTTVQSYDISKKNDDMNITPSLNDVQNADDSIFLRKQDEDIPTDNSHSMPQTTTVQYDHDSEKCDHIKIWRPATEAPSPNYVLETRRLYGLPHERHQKAFCSDPKDLPSATRVVGGRRLQISSLSVDEMTEFDLGGNFQTLHKLRGLVGDHMDNSLLRDCLRSLDTHGDNDGYVGVHSELKLALMGDKEVVITPVTLPPSPKDVREWMKSRGTGNHFISKPQEQKLVGKDNDISQDPERNIIPDEVEVPSIPKNGNSPKRSNSGIQVSRNSTHVIHTPQLNPSFNLREISQPTEDVSQNNPRDVLIGPQHSTPVGNLAIKSRKFLQCTPIEVDEMKCLKQDLEGKVSEKFCEMKSLRRNILNSQVKERDFKDKQQPSPCEASYIEGPTPTNSFGFKISQPNIQDAKSVRQVQFLTLLSVELHVRTRKTLRPDPEFDPICAIFYHIEHETKQGKQYKTGIIVARNESTKLRSSDVGTSSSTASGDNASSSMQTTYHSTSERTSYEDSLLRTAGISKELHIITENEETDAIHSFIKLIHDWDPDILLGFEVQMLSWGYLIHRATALGIDLIPQISRVQDSSGTARFDAGKDQWGANHTSEISISGRIVLNVWRLMRHEVTLNVYSFENISYHVLHERIPLYTYRQLTQWWDRKLPHDRWRTVEHYVIRCQGNIRILNHVDFINRTSEFARLYGILFYSVISRGSQFRVESMMLRLAKPMKYLAVSPSIQQRARMDAPECIALVMEPESRFYADPVIVLDFQSLYPSMIIAYNYCFSTCLGKVSRLDKIGNFDFGCTSLNVPPALLEKLEDDIHVSANGAAFVKSNIRRGILPRMLEEILDTRVMVKKAMKEHKNDKVLGQLLDARQLGLKLIANVTYGYTSAYFSGRMPCVEIAEAIVRKARETLERAIHLVNSRKEWGARVVYGDTDSLFVLVKGATKEEAFQIGKDIVDAVTAENPKPVKLKFEKVYLPCVLQTKKRYVGYMYETLEQKEPVFDAKGIETVRRDTCPAVAKILEKSLRILFEEKDISLVKKFVQRQFCKLMEERVSLQDFIFAKEYRGMKGYKPTACVPALELARHQLSRDRRAEPRVGERVPYLVVNGSPGLPLIQLVRSPGDVLEDSSLRLNSSYYINKQMIPPLNRVFSLIGIDVFSWYTELPRYVPRHHVATGKQKSSISRFFTTLHCPVCEQLTQQGLCRGCRDNPQKAVVMLAERVGNWERKYSHLKEICFQCCGTRDKDVTCISLDCPVMFKRIKMRRKLEYGETLRDVQKGIEVTNS